MLENHVYTTTALVKGLARCSKMLGVTECSFVTQIIKFQAAKLSDPKFCVFLSNFL